LTTNKHTKILNFTLNKCIQYLLLLDAEGMLRYRKLYEPLENPPERIKEEWEYYIQRFHIELALNGITSEETFKNLLLSKIGEKQFILRFRSLWTA
jgi:hypothetical protein